MELVWRLQLRVEVVARTFIHLLSKCGGGVGWGGCVEIISLVLLVGWWMVFFVISGGMWGELASPH